MACSRREFGDVATAVRVMESTHSVGVYVLADSPSADFALLIASRCARDLSGYKAVSGQPFCSAISISRESISRRFLVWKRQALDGSACKRNLERIATLHPQRSDV